MKHLIPLLAIAVILSSCNQDFRSRGPISSAKRELAAFHGISSDAVAKIILVQDSPRFAIVTTYQNLIPGVTTEIENGILHVSMKKEFANISNPKVTVEVHAPDISEIEMSGVGSVEVKDSFRFQNISIRIDGVGSIQAAGTAKVARLENNGTGAINASSLRADSVYAITAGVGSIECFAVTYLKAIVQGIGSISYKGNPVVEKSVEGIGSIKKEKE